MENNNVNVTTNEKKEAEKKPSVFKTICGFITWGIGALLFITVATGGLDDLFYKLQMGGRPGNETIWGDTGKADQQGNKITYKEDAAHETTYTSSGYRTGDELEIVWNDDAQSYLLEVKTENDSFVYDEYVTDWLIGKSCYIMDNYVVDRGGVSITQTYFFMDNAYYSYINGNNFLDLRGINAVSELNNLMRKNDYFANIIIEGQILNIEEQGNVIQIFDMSTSEENLYIYENGGNYSDLICYVDISMLDNKDEYFVNDTVTIYANYCGRVETTDGSYQPLIVAVAMELQ